jgi:hypothetical protein
MTDLFAHHRQLQKVADEDVRFLKIKDRSYGASWKLAGGRSAWFMLRRKMDRMIAMMARPPLPEGISLNDLEDVRKDALLEQINNKSRATDYLVAVELLDWMVRGLRAEDIFYMIEADRSGDDGSVLAEVRDLRRYLLLVEAEIEARHTVAPPEPNWPGTPDDGGHHSYIEDDAPARDLNNYEYLQLPKDAQKQYHWTNESGGKYVLRDAKD